MKNLTVNRNSWHFKLASYGLLDTTYRQLDLCQYFWALARGLGRAPVSILAGVLVLYCLIVSPLMALWVWAAWGAFVPDEPAFVGMGFALFICVGCGVIYALEADYKTPSAVRLARAGYRGWKEKTCVLIEVK